MKRLTVVAMFLFFCGPLVIKIVLDFRKELPIKQTFEINRGQIETDEGAPKDTNPEGERTVNSAGKTGVGEIGELAKLNPVGINLKPEMVLIPPGRFLMGVEYKSMGEGILRRGRAIEENRMSEPQNEVLLTMPFELGKYEVTVGLWNALMNEEGEQDYFNNPNFPKTGVSLAGCREFIKRLNAKTEGGYRLPTEAEWEYACRAGSKTEYSFGDTITPKDARYGVKKSLGFNDSKISKTVAVGSYKPNGFGLFDMHGNAAELCESYFVPYPRSEITLKDWEGGLPLNPSEYFPRVVRGGCFLDSEMWVRSISRIPDPGPGKNDGIGFRLARTK